MSACPRGPDFVLSADLADPEVALHVAECSTCRKAVARIRSTYAVLDDVLGAPPEEPLDVEALVRRSRLDRTVAEARARWGGRAGFALLAAAALAGVLLARRPEPPAAPPAREISSLRTPHVEASSHNFAVLPTRDPDITIVWFYERRP